MFSTAIAALITSVAGLDTPDILYRYTDAYEIIWNDSGSGGNKDVTIWRAKNFQSEFCSLGDVATGNYNLPHAKAVLVTAKKKGALVHPTSFTKVWDDSGSGADWDVSVYKMNAPPGYTCLGGVAMRSHWMQPDASQYCCVKNDYVVKASVVQVYNDAGTGADKDLSLWATIRSSNDAYGLDAGNFIGVSGYHAPSIAYLLKSGEKVSDELTTPAELKQLNLYEMTVLKLIWHDGGSGADADCSIWRPDTPPGYYPIGDVAVASHKPPNIVFAIRPTDLSDDSLRVPVSYQEIWNDAGSGADRDVKIWKPNCPGGYVSLGHVATGGPRPEVGSIYCVKSAYTTAGGDQSWKLIWRDHGSGADKDVTIWQAHPTYAQAQVLQTVRGMGAIASHSGLPATPFFLNKDFVAYVAEKPISKIYMSNVQYDLDGEKRLSAPVKMSPTIIQNTAYTPQVVWRTLTYSLAKSSTFTFGVAIQIGIAVEYSGGVPLIGGTKTTISAGLTSSFTTGNTTTETKDDSISAHVTVPARSRMTVFIVAKEYKADIPFTANIKKEYFDGSVGRGVISGVYKGVSISEATVQFGEAEPMDQRKKTKKLVSYSSPPPTEKSPPTEK